MKNRITGVLVSAAMCISVFGLLYNNEVNIDDDMLCYAETPMKQITLNTGRTIYTTTTTTTVTTEIAVSTYGPDTKYDYEGTFSLDYSNSNKKWQYYVGEELKKTNFDCCLHAKTKYGWYTNSLASYPAYGGMLDKYYTIDTSEVDMNTPGKYKIYVDTIEDNIVPVFVSGGNQYIPRGEYNILTKKSEERRFLEIQVIPAPYETPFSFKKSSCRCPDGEEKSITLFGSDDPDINITVEDPSVVEVSGYELSDYTSPVNGARYGIVKLKGLKPGETTVITAVDREGRTAECEVFVEYTDKSYPEGSIYFAEPTNLLKGRVGNWMTTYVKGYIFDWAYEDGESPFSFGIDDESVAVIENICGNEVIVAGVSVGETVLRAEAPDGRTAEIKVIVTEQPPIVITTPTAATTTTRYCNYYTTVNTNVDIPGDLNGDKKVSVADLVMLNNMINNKKDFSTAADINRDGTINVFDVITLRRMILGE